MLWHYFTAAWRNFRRQKMVTLINILCLSFGLASFMVTYAIVRYLETSENHFSNAARIRVISTSIALLDGSSPSNTLFSAEHVAKYLKADFPELEAVARLRSMGETAVSTGERNAYIEGVAVDPEFLSVFDLRFVTGGAEAALRQPRSAIIEDSLALSLFGTTDAIGRRVLLDGLTDVMVTGVYAAIPASSSFRFKLAASWDVHETYMLAVNPDRAVRPPEEIWSSTHVTTYALLPASGALSDAEFQSRLIEFIANRVPAEQRWRLNLRLNAVPFDELQVARLNEVIFSNTGAAISITTVILVLGTLILGVACINYGNLSAAQTVQHFKEIGTRRVVGASTRQVLMLGLSQTAIYVLLSLLISIVAVLVLSPLAQQTLDVDMRAALLAGGELLVLVPLLLAVVTMVGGSYAAIRSMSVRPAFALRATDAAQTESLGSMLLIGVQFAAASFLLISVMVMQQQTVAVRQAALAAKSGSVLLLGNNLNDARISFDTYKSAHAGIPHVQALSATAMRPWTQAGSWVVNLSPRAEARQYSAIIHFVEQDFFETLQIPLLAGRRLEASRGSDVITPDWVPFDPAMPQSIVIDRVFATTLGYGTPEAAVGQLVYLPMRGSDGPWRPFRIVGVVEDKPLSFHSFGAGGAVYQLAARPQVPILRISAHDISGALRAMEETWAELAPNIPLDVRFLEETFEQGYRPFARLHFILNSLVVVALVIAVAGLMAIAIHEMNQRRREIAVRRTLGATKANVSRKLLSEFSIPVVAGNFIAWPLAYLACQSYLNLFMYRIELPFWPFLLSLVCTLLISWIAVGLQAFRTATLKPATVLRYE